MRNPSMLTLCFPLQADNIEQLESRKESIASDQARLQKEITQSENCRDTLQQELAEVKEAAAKSADEDSELQKKYDETHHKLAAIQSKKYEIEQRRMKLEGDLKTLNYELTKLTTVRDSRLQRIQEMNQGADAHKAYKWIQANRTRFNGKVFGPIVRLSLCLLPVIILFLYLSYIFLSLGHRGKCAKRDSRQLLGAASSQHGQVCLRCVGPIGHDNSSKGTKGSTASLYHGY
jgi:septal ring factor EnvC (AmiA/AmiB activator)